MTDTIFIDLRGKLNEYLNEPSEENPDKDNTYMVCKGLVDKAKQGDSNAAKLIWQIETSDQSINLPDKGNITLTFSSDTEGIRFKEKGDDNEEPET